MRFTSWSHTAILGRCHTHPSVNMGLFISTIWLKRQWWSQNFLLWKNTCLWLFSLPGRNSSLKNVSVHSLNYFSQVQSLNCDFKNWPLCNHRSLSAWRHERTWSSSFALNVQNKARADVVKTELRVPPGGRKHATLSFMEIPTTGNLQTHNFVPLALPFKIFFSTDVI